MGCQQINVGVIQTRDRAGSVRRREMLRSVAAAGAAMAFPPSRSDVAAASLPPRAQEDQAIDPLPDSVYRGRLQRAQALMDEYDYAAVFCEPGTNFAYLAGASFGRSERLLALILPRSGEPAVVAPNFEVERVERALALHAGIRGWREDENPHRLVAQVLTSAGRGRVGIEPSTRFGVVSQLRDVMPDREFVDATSLFTRLRIIKAAEELALIRSAISITQRAIAVTFALVPAGERGERMRRYFESHGVPVHVNGIEGDITVRLREGGYDVSVEHAQAKP